MNHSSQTPELFSKKKNKVKLKCNVYGDAHLIINVLIHIFSNQLVNSIV